MTVLRQGLLDGRAIVVAGGVPSVVVDALGGLGARVQKLDTALEDRAREWATRASPLHALVFDAGSAFGDGGSPGSVRRSSGPGSRREAWRPEH